MHGDDAPPRAAAADDELHVAERIACAASAADGPLARAALRAAGLTDDAIDHRLRTGSLRRVHHGVHVPGHDVLGRRGRWRAALAAVGGAGALSHATGLSAWDLRASAARLVHLSVPGNGGRRHRREELVVHRCRGLTPADVVDLDGLRVTSVAWTIRTAAATSSVQGVVRLLERSEVLQLFDLPAFLDVVERGRGAPGTRRLREALGLWTGEPVMTRSELEERVLEAVAGTRLDGPLVNELVCGEEADFHWPALRVVLEVDGWETHRTRPAFERDRARDARRQAAGWRTTRATYRQVRDDWAAVAAALLAPAGGGGASDP